MTAANDTATSGQVRVHAVRIVTDDPPPLVACYDTLLGTSTPAQTVHEDSDGDRGHVSFSRRDALEEVLPPAALDAAERRGIPDVEADDVDAHVNVLRAAGATIVDEPAGAENVRHQAIFVNHAPGGVTPLNPEMAQVGDAAGQRAQWRGLLKGPVRPVGIVEVLVLPQHSIRCRWFQIKVRSSSCRSPLHDRIHPGRLNYGAGNPGASGLNTVPDAAVKPASRSCSFTRVPGNL